MRAPLFLAVCLLLCGSLRAQDFPNKPVRIVVPYPPAGSTDFVARAIQPKLQELWRQPVVIDNRGGASGMIGSELVAKATPDGYTLLFGGLQTHAMNSAVIRNVPYDPVKDFTPISQITRSNWMLAVNPSLGVTRPADLVTLLRANPDKYSYSSSGNGSAAHLGFAMLASELNVRVLHVPYKGIGQAIADTVSGQVQMVMSDQSTLLGHIRAGRLNAIAMTGNVRSPLQPEVPTIAETIVPGFDIQSWNGIWGPPGLPAPLVRQINQTLVAATNAPETVERLKKGGSEPVGSTPEAFGELVRREVQRWVDSAKKANITPE